MYIDSSPHPHFEKALVVESGDTDVEQVIAEAPNFEEEDGTTIYVIVFEEDPGRVWDFTERSLRGEFKRRAA